MRKLTVTAVSYHVVTDTSNDTVPDRKRALGMVADIFSYRNIGAHDTEKWNSPLARQVDIIAVIADEISPVIVRTFDADGEADVAMVAAANRPEADPELMQLLDKATHELADSDSFICSLKADPEYVTGIVVDVISTPTSDCVIEHYNLTRIDMERFLETRTEPTWLKEFLDSLPEDRIDDKG